MTFLRVATVSILWVGIFAWRMFVHAQPPYGGEPYRYTGPYGSPSSLAHEQQQDDQIRETKDALAEHVQQLGTALVENRAETVKNRELMEMVLDEFGTMRGEVLGFGAAVCLLQTLGLIAQWRKGKSG